MTFAAQRERDQAGQDFRDMLFVLGDLAESSCGCEPKPPHAEHAHDCLVARARALLAVVTTGPLAVAYESEVAWCGKCNALTGPAIHSGCPNNQADCLGGWAQPSTTGDPDVR